MPAVSAPPLPLVFLLPPTSPLLLLLLFKLLARPLTAIMRNEGVNVAKEQLFKYFKKTPSNSVMLHGPTDQPPACSVIPPQQEPGSQAPASDPHHDASQCPAPTHSDPSSGTGKTKTLWFTAD